LEVVPTLFVVSIAIFLLLILTPGDMVSQLLGEDATADDVARVRRSMGLDDSLPIQYLRWIGNVLTGNLGYSPFLRQSVSQAIIDHFAPTAQLAMLAMIVVLCLAIPLGTLAAKRRGGVFDQAVMGFTLIGMAVPSFVLGLVLVVVFAVWLRVLPVAGYVPPEQDVVQWFRLMLLPALALGTIVAALITRVTRATMLDTLHAGYIDSARSRGVGEGRLLFAHALRNAGPPILTVVGLAFGSLMTGALVTETIFNIPGIGSLLVNAITRRDYVVIQGVTLFITAMYIGINLVVDLLYGIIDPRIRLGQ
jgi:peptide/nickel transport system permease protein